MLITSIRPRFEGANIRTWIGFKQLMSMVEEAVLQWHRQHGLGPHRLYHEHGLGLQIVDSSVLLAKLLEIDDEVDVHVGPTSPGRFAVTVRRAHTSLVVLTAKVSVVCIREPERTSEIPLPVVHAVDDVDLVVAPDVESTARHVERLTRVLAPDADVRSVLEASAPGALHWPWRASYFSCHYSDRVQHSAFTRALEEVVDRYLAECGLAIPQVLAERGWIPVVSKARVRTLADAHMGEIVHTRFHVEGFLKDAAYDCRMDGFVQRGSHLVHVATANILHGYAYSRGPSAGRLVSLDPATMKTLTRRGE